MILLTDANIYYISNTNYKRIKNDKPLKSKMVKPGIDLF